MNYAERIRDLTDKFMQEMENLKTKNTVVTGEKEKEASKHAEQVHDLVEKQNKELQDLGKASLWPSCIEPYLFTEGSNNQKLMLEYEKYQDLQAKTQKTQEEYERQITELENRKEEEVTRQRMQYTAQLEKLKNDLILVSDLSSHSPFTHSSSSSLGTREEQTTISRSRRNETTDRRRCRRRDLETDANTRTSLDRM